MGRVVSAVDDQPVQLGKLGNGMRKQCLFPGGIRVKSSGQGGAGGGEAENGRGRFRAAAVASLLTAALQQRREGLQSGRDIQRAAALGTVDFMGRNGDQVRAQRLRGEGDFQEALHRVGVENCVGAEPVGQPRHLLNGHDGTGLVVDHHDGNQNGVLLQSGFQRVHGDAPQTVRLQIGHGEALRFQILHAV